MTNQGVSPVIEAIRELEVLKGSAKKQCQLLNYYRKNEQRMQYHQFKEKGLLIAREQ